MLKFGRWFSYSTPQEKAEHEQAYFLSVFPFGEQQKRTEEALLKDCIQAPVTENEKMYQLLLAKDLYRNTKGTEREAGLKKWFGAALLKRWPESDKAILLSLAQLSLKAESLEMLPDVESVLSHGAEIERELVPKLKSKGKYL